MYAVGLLPSVIAGTNWNLVHRRAGTAHTFFLVVDKAVNGDVTTTIIIIKQKNALLHNRSAAYVIARARARVCNIICP